MNIRSTDTPTGERVIELQTTMPTKSQAMTLLALATIASDGASRLVARAQLHFSATLAEVETRMQVRAMDDAGNDVRAAANIETLLRLNATCDGACTDAEHAGRLLGTIPAQFRPEEERAAMVKYALHMAALYLNAAETIAGAEVTPLHPFS